MALSHVFSSPIADGTNTQLVRPSNWNSAHNFFQTISGNTAGQSTFSGTNMVIQGGDNITLSANTSPGAATLIISAAPGGGAGFTAGISGGNTSGDTGTVSNRLVIAGGNNITASGSTDANGMTVTLSGANAGGAQTGISVISAGTAALTAGTAVFSNSNGISFGLNGSTLTASAGLHASQIAVYGNHTEDADVQHMINEGMWAGWIKGGAFTTTTGGSFSVGTGEGWFRTADDPTARLFYGSWDSTTGTIPTNGARYVFANYNGGTPTLSVATAQTTSPHMQVYVGEVHRPSGVIQAHADPRPAGDFGRRILDWTHDLIGTRVSSGEVVTDPSSPSHKLKVTAGVFWDKHLIRYTSALFDTSGTDTFTYVYRDGAGDWTRVGANTDWDGTHYDDGTGTLAAMTSGYWANVYVLRSFTGGIYLQYGWGQYTTRDAAILEETPTSRPEELDEHGFYIARITFSYGASGPDTILDIRPMIGGAATAGGAGDGFNILAAGTQTAGTAATVQFGNANGVTFGMSNSSVITASHNGLTTAAQSDHSHGNPTLALTNISGTTASNSAGFTLSLSANVGGGAGDGYNILAAGTQTANTTGTVLFNNANGITFGMNNSSVITASHNGLTQQSTQPVAYSAANGSALFSTLSLANSNGVSFSTGTQGVYATVKTDYQSSNANYLTSQSNQAVSAANGSYTFQTMTLANSNGVSFSTGTQGIYATVKTDYLTTARASNDAIGLNTAQTNVTWTVNSSGLSINAAGYAGTATTFAGTNVSATIGLNSAGLNLALSGVGGGVINQTGPNIADSVNTITSGTVVFANSPTVTFGLNGSTMTASAAGGGGGGATLSVFNNVPAINQTMTLNGASVSHVAFFELPVNHSVGFIRFPVLMTTNSTTISTTASSRNVVGEIYSTWNAVLYTLGTGASSKSLVSVAKGSNGWTFQNSLSIATNGTQYSVTQGFSAHALGAGTTRTTGYSISNTNYSLTTNQIATEWSSGRFLDIPLNTVLAPGAYWLVFGYSSSSSTNSAGNWTNCNVKYSAHYGMSQTNMNFGVMGSTNLTSGMMLGAGSFSTVGGGTVAAFPISAISSSASHVLPLFQLHRSA